MELIEELVYEKGTIVFSNAWDSGGLGAGADSEIVYLFRKRYWSRNSTLGLAGPFSTLREAKKGSLLRLGSAQSAGRKLRSRLHSNPGECGFRKFGTWLRQKPPS